MESPPPEEAPPRGPGGPAGAAGPDDDRLQAQPPPTLKFVSSTGDGLFSIRRPKHVGSGVASGLKSLAKGVGMGLGFFLISPLIGALTNGFKGFGLGLATGLITLVLFPTIGASICLIQVTRGLVNTPGAIRAFLDRRSGRGWQIVSDAAPYDEARDDTMRQAWAAAAAAGALPPGLAPPPRGGGRGSGRAGRGAPAEYVDLYLLLEVPREASPEAIKKAYHKAARALHPDKNPGDPNAHARFLALGQAYQILSDPDARARYDAHGEAGVAEAVVDPAVLFVAAFDLGRWMPYMGTPTAAAARIAAMLSAGGGPSEAELQRMQARREEALARKLSNLLRPHYAARGAARAAFTAWAAREAAILAGTACGVLVAELVAQAYDDAASVALGRELAGVEDLPGPDSGPGGGPAAAAARAASADGPELEPTSCSGSGGLGGAGSALGWAAAAGEVVGGFFTSNLTAASRSLRATSHYVAARTKLAGLAFRMLREVSAMQAEAHKEAQQEAQEAEEEAARQRATAAMEAAFAPIEEEGWEDVSRAEAARPAMPVGAAGGRAPAAAGAAAGPLARPAGAGTTPAASSSSSRPQGSAAAAPPPPAPAAAPEPAPAEETRWAFGGGADSRPGGLPGGIPGFGAWSPFGAEPAAGTSGAAAAAHGPAPAAPAPASAAAGPADGVAAAPRPPALTPEQRAAAAQARQEERAKKVFDATAPTMLETAWSFAAIDLMSTIGAVGAKVLADPAVPRPERRARAHAMRAWAAALAKAAAARRAAEGATAGGLPEPEGAMRRVQELAARGGRAEDVGEDAESDHPEPWPGSGAAAA